jgi:hypothetical protein
MLTIGLRPFGKMGSFDFTFTSLTQLPIVWKETTFLSHPKRNTFIG